MKMLLFINTNKWKKEIKILVKENKKNDVLLKKIRDKYVIDSIPKLYKNVVDQELKECIEYALKNGHQMYYYKEFEQSEKSPHRYLSDSFNIENGIVIDIGAAEGNFSLSIIDMAQHVYIFECDEGWIEALQYSFADYKNKVSIIQKYVSNKNSDNQIILDTFYENNCLTDIELKNGYRASRDKCVKRGKTSYYNK